MTCYYAPMEGIVNHVYRSAHAKCFKGIDRYFAPFIVADQTRGFMEKDRDDILPDNNRGFVLIPQILTNNADDFLNTARKIAAFGYNEINLNLGCPSKKVVSGGRGAGFLSEFEALERFLDTIFSKSDVKISIKTRIGRYSPNEFDRLLDLYNRHPLTELIIHPRIQTDMYLNTPNFKVFESGLQNSKNATIYNGDVKTRDDYDNIIAHYSGNANFKGIMIGRGLLMNPSLCESIKNDQKRYTIDDLRTFHTALLEGQLNYLKLPHKVLAKMKEAWHYLFMPLEAPKEMYIAIRQAQDMANYLSAVEALLYEAEVRITS